ncbi:hypothetical protein BDN67DRAFT_968142 [Paxillus ammoniavirescens]|nr:hypothetical protein BDN67DRAFT_968142 [Paxillus ammoniavirescens]
MSTSYPMAVYNYETFSVSMVKFPAIVEAHGNLFPTCRADTTPPPRGSLEPACGRLFISFIFSAIPYVNSFFLPTTHAGCMAGSLPQFSVPDDSPEISYFPFVNLVPSPNVTDGWQLLYNGSGAATAPGQLGVGVSYHYTTLNGASFMIDWNGTGIDLIGTAVNASYQLILDGFPTTAYSSDPANTILASFNDLPNSNHTLLLTTNITNTISPNSFVTFDKALVTYAPPTGIVNTTAASQTIDDSDIAFMGQWSYIADSTGNSMHASNSAGDRAQAMFFGSAITIYGLISSYSGNYTVTLDNVTTSLSAQSSYNNSDTLLFYATNLPQGMLHLITVTNQEDRTLALRVGGMNVTVFGNVTTSSPNSSNSSSIPAGTIAALVLAGVLCLVIFGALYYACFLRRKTRPVKKRAAPPRTQTFDDEKVDPNIERVIDISPPPGEEELEFNSLSTNKGYGFGLGVRRGFPFAYRKGKAGSSSSGKSRSGNGVQAESHPMTSQYDHDDKRFSLSTLTADLPVLPHAPESEKLAPGWTNPIARTSFASKNSYAGLGQHGFLLPELLVEMVGTAGDDNDYDTDADAKTLTSRQDEALAATLTLCPRTSEAPAGFGTAMDSMLGVDGQDYTRQPRQSQQNSHFLEVRETSPFRVDVAAILGTPKGNRDSRRTSGSGSSTWSKVRRRLYRRAHRDDGRQSYHTDRQEASSSSGPESVPVVLLESESGVPPSETAPASGTYSFLDLTSPHASSRRHSKTTLSSNPADVGHEHRATSSWSDNTSVKMVRIERSRDDITTSKPDAPSTVSRGSHPETSSDNSNGYTHPSAPTIHTHGSSPFPFPVTIPPSTHMPHPFNVVPERYTPPSPPPPVPSHISHQFLQVRQFSPHEPISPVNSLTESVPFSVSDIHFRHSFSDYAEVDSRRGSAASTLPPHPPLPHHGGSQPSSPAYSPPPPYVVQRVLGLPMTPLIPPPHVGRATAPPVGRPSTSYVSSTGRPLGTAAFPTSPPTSQFRIGSLLGPRPRPSRPRPSTAGSARGTAAPQLPMQGGRTSLRTNQR